MGLYYLQHVPFEDPANIAVWAGKRGHSVSGSALYDGQQIPAPNQFDWLVILGGPMNVYEEQRYPWLTTEKKFIAEAIAQKKIVIGICLGAQLIADVLGARVYKNSQDEGVAGMYVQTPREMVAPYARFGEIERMLDTLLDNLAHQG